MRQVWLPVKELLSGKHEGELVSLRGWIYRTRSSGKIAFTVIRDSTGIIQVTIVKNEVEELESFESARKALMESSVKVTGILKKDDRAPGGFEILASIFNVVDYADIYPITKDQSEVLLRDNRHLWLRSRRMTSILKIRSTVTGAIHDFFRGRGYHEFTPPIFQPNQAEGGSSLFEVKYFDKKTYLSQTWQLYAEAAIFSLEKIYDVSPTFRAEKSRTSRHICEFWMAEMEAAWMDLAEVTEIAKEELKFILARVMERNTEDLKILQRDVTKLMPSLEKPFPTITYTKALEILKDEHGMEVEWGKDLRTLEENKLMESFDTPVVVIFSCMLLSYISVF